MDPFLRATIGEYRITGLLGEGGMGRVYRAVHPRLGREAAIKVLTAATGDRVFLERFLNEARIQCRLRDPGVASLYDYTEYHGTPVMIMEYVDGETLEQITARQGAWSPAQAIPVLRACARTLSYVHGQGIVHRDLKSANVKVSSAGEVKLLDFGIATNAGAAMQRLTTSGFVIGSFQSLSPEQTRGEQATAASDIWSFGVLLYELLTASLPFEAGSAAELFTKIGRARYTPPTVLRPSLPKAVEPVIARCLRREPGDRFSSMAELENELARLEGTLSRPHRIPTRGISFGQTSSSWPLIAGCAAAVLVLAAALVFLLSSSNLTSTQTQPQATLSTNASTSSSNAETHRVTIDTFGGSAEVWKGGQHVGDTPYTVEQPVGDTVDVVLKRPSYRDLPVHFEVGQRSNYEFGMERSEP